LKEGVCLFIGHGVKRPRIDEHGFALARTELALSLFRFGRWHEFSHGHVVARNDYSLSSRDAGQQFLEVGLGVCDLNVCHENSMINLDHHFYSQMDRWNNQQSKKAYACRKPTGCTVPIQSPCDDSLPIYLSSQIGPQRIIHDDSPAIGECLDRVADIRWYDCD
jgi:hypothetical protein